MKTVKVNFANGDYVVTGINGTADEIKAYFVGKFFNLGNGENDNMQEAKLIEFLA